MRERSTSMMAAARPASSIPPSSADGPSKGLGLGLAAASAASNRSTRVAVCGVSPTAAPASGPAVLFSSFRTASKVTSASPPDLAILACSKKWSLSSGSIASQAAVIATSLSSSSRDMRRHTQNRS